MKLKLRLLFMLIASLGSLRAASLLVLLSNPSQTGAPGDVLPFFGTMTNVSPTDTIFLNSISSSSGWDTLTLAGGPFFLNAPLSLGPGHLSGLLGFFVGTLDPATPEGLYSGNTVSIQGGA